MAFPFLVGALCLNSSLAVNQSTWNNKHITNYTMTVQTFAPPQPAVTVQVVVRNGKITNEKLMECEAGQSEYLPNLCEAIKTYYYAPGGRFTYTMDDVFQYAQFCTEQTNISVAKYGLIYQIGFTGFSSKDAMYDFERAYRTSLQSSNLLCSVEYDPVYGYPKEIITSIPQVNDGGSVIVVKDFRVND